MKDQIDKLKVSPTIRRVYDRGDITESSEIKIVPEVVELMFEKINELTDKLNSLTNEK